MIRKKMLHSVVCAKAANIIDGSPKCEDVVSVYSNAPNALDTNDWVTVARHAALTWANDLADYFDAAKKIKNLYS